ncbi:MAG: hypothetical protein H6686_09250 [Fibrobacteria bacterium]|nr:hypothetical protein [Fibrobacteria bacterium]
MLKQSILLLTCLLAARASSQELRLHSQPIRHDIKGFSVGDTTWVSWSYNDPVLWDEGVMILTSDDGKSWKPAHKTAIRFQYDTLPANELLPKVFLGRAKIALSRTQFKPAWIEKVNKQLRQPMKPEEKQMAAAMSTSTLAQKNGYLAGALSGVSGAILGKPSRFVGLARKGSSTPLVSSEVHAISPLVEVKTISYVYPTRKIHFHVKDSAAHMSNLDKGLPKLQIGLASEGNLHEGSLIPFIELRTDSAWVRELYSVQEAGTIEFNEHKSTFPLDTYGKRIRVTPSVLGVYEGPSREIEVTDIYPKD